MKTQSVNPLNGEVIQEFELWSERQTEQALERAFLSQHNWRQTKLQERLRLIQQLAKTLEQNKKKYSEIITDEMGKTQREAIAEIEKCAVTCKFLSENLQDWFATEKVASPQGSWEVVKEPMGVLVGIMPWNFPFWQVLRFAVPAIGLGNTILLKHASNVFGCSEKIHGAFLEAGFPEGVFQHAPLSSQQVLKVIPDRRVRGVSLTGSTAAGKSVGEVAGKNLKKVVLELGGSDAYVILDDADLDLATTKCVDSRLLNAGQSCVSAKRFIVTKKNVKSFGEMFIEKMKHKTFGDPNDEKMNIGPLARKDLRDQLHTQVGEAVKDGAKLALGGKIPDGKGAFYPPSILVNVDEKNVAFREELFGPVAAIVTADNEDHAIELANKSSYGLGSGVFSRDRARALEIARHRLDAGMSFVNDYVKSDVRIPFGGVKDSGIGRELGRYGVLEFANIKSVVSI
jgi:succinate-semialdehyde dehydrogenase/glutarate-semialdehyde dehydrogenase